MNNREIFNAAKNNNIRNLLRAKKEVRQIHNARNITETMYLNDIAMFEKIMNRARQMIDSILDDVRVNMEIRRKAYSLLGKDYIVSSKDLNSVSMFEEESSWRKMLHIVFSKRYFNIESINIEDLYDKAKICRIRTIIFERGMENLFNQMSMEAMKIRLDTANINFFSDMMFEIEGNRDERIESIKKLVAECLRNKLWVNEGAINQCYFQKVEEISNVINQYYGREDCYDRM